MNFYFNRDMMSEIKGDEKEKWEETHGRDPGKKSRDLTKSGTKRRWV